MKPMTYNLLRREWLQYKSFGRTWLWIWVLYLGMYLLLGMAAGFVVVFLPIIMAYSAIYSAKQTGEAVNAGTEDFLLPVPLRDVLWAKYLFAFLMGSASAVVVLAAVLFQTLLNPEEAINPFYVLGVTMTYTAVITGVGMPLLYRFGATKARFTLLVLMGISAALGGSAAVVGLAALGGVPDSISIALTITAVVLWALMPFSLRLTERFYRRGGVDHERHPIVEACLCPPIPLPPAAPAVRGESFCGHFIQN